MRARLVFLNLWNVPQIGIRKGRQTGPNDCPWFATVSNRYWNKESIVAKRVSDMDGRRRERKIGVNVTARIQPQDGGGRNISQKKPEMQDANSTNAATRPDGSAG